MTSHRGSAQHWSQAIAIVGVAGKYPLSANVCEYWQRLIQKQDCTQPIDSSRWNHHAFYSSSKRDPDKYYATRMGLIDKIEHFAADLFGIAPRRAESMDPQQRILLEICYDALLDAGYAPFKDSQGRFFDREKTGVFIGASQNDYREISSARLRAQQLAQGELGSVAVASHHSLDTQSFAPMPAMRAFTMPGCTVNMIAANVAQAFHLSGPAFTIDAACSSSLVAVVQAVTYLRQQPISRAKKQSDSSPLALAGGVCLQLVPDNLIGFSRLGMLAEQEARPFDAAQTGLVLGEGAGALVLKRLQDATRDGDRIYAVIRGVACNNDGHSTLGYLQPDPKKLTALYEQALADAQMHAHDIEYFECHGTATTSGDLAEIQAIHHLLRKHGAAEQLDSPRFIGSVKANIGHSISAAGIASLTKAALSVYHGQMPPVPYFEQWHAQMQTEAQNLSVPTTVLPWTSSVKKAGVHAFGLGGTNACVLLESAPQTTPVLQNNQRSELFLFSANDPALLKTYLNEFLGALKALYYTSIPLSDLAYTVTCVRPLLDYAAIVVGSDVKTLEQHIKVLIEQLENPPSKLTMLTSDLALGPVLKTRARIGFLFPGQGAQTPNSFLTLKNRYVEFYKHCERLIESFKKSTSLDLAPLLFPSVDADMHTVEEQLKQTQVCQPALAVLESACVHLLHQFGLYADVHLGHSLGELVALSLSGVLKEDTCIEFLHARGRAIAEKVTKKSQMIAVIADRPTVSALAQAHEVYVSNENQREQIVVAGAIEKLARFADTLREKRIPFVYLQVSHGFHSPCIEEAQQEINRLVDSLKIKRSMPTHVPQVISAVTPGVYNMEPAAIKQIWTQHACSPVRFVEAIEKAHQEPPALWIQVGPQHALVQCVNAYFKDSALAVKKPLTISLGVLDNEDKQLLLACALARCLGHSVSLRRLYPAQAQVVHMPPVPLLRARYWLFNHDTLNTATRLALEPIVTQVKTLPNVSSHPLFKDTQAIEKQVLLLVSQVSTYPVSMLQLSSRFKEDLAFDSIMSVDFLTLLESTFHVTPKDPKQVLESWLCINDVVKWISSNLLTQECQNNLDYWRSAWVPVSTALMPTKIDKDDYYAILYTASEQALAQQLANALQAQKATAVLVSWDIDLDSSALLEDKTPLPQWRHHILIAITKEPDAKHLGQQVLILKKQLLKKSYTQCFLVSVGSSLLDSAISATSSVWIPWALTLNQEWQKTKASVLQLNANDSISVRVSAVLTLITQSVDPVIRLFEKGTYYQQDYQCLPAHTGVLPQTLHTQDVLLVTGGLSDLMMQLLPKLLQFKVRAVALIARQTEPLLSLPKQQWLAELRKNHPATIIRVYAADLSKTNTIAGVLTPISTECGAPSVVIHAAGVPAVQTIRAMQLSTLEDACAIKTVALSEIMTCLSVAPRLVVAITSWAGVLGHQGQAAYAMANHQLAQWIDTHRSNYKKTTLLALSYPFIRDVGMSKQASASYLSVLAEQGVSVITSIQAEQAFLQALQRGYYGHVVIGQKPPLLFVESMPNTPIELPISKQMNEIPESMYVFAQFPEYQQIQSRVEFIHQHGLRLPYFLENQTFASSHIQSNGRLLLGFSCYNYVGMSGHQEVSLAAKQAIDTYGTSNSCSRLALENPIQKQLEQQIATFLGAEAAVVMVGGHATNVTTVGHLAKAGDLILFDALSHNSILEGTKLSGATKRSFPHNDYQGLARILAATRHLYRRVLVVIEGAYSMDGDIPNLPEFLKLREQYRFLLMVDEAHSLGVLGAHGRGICEHYQVDPKQVDILMGTLSKSLASCGGYIAGSQALVDYLKFTAPGFVFSVGIPPADAAAALASLKVLMREPERVRQLQVSAHYFLQRVKSLGFNTGHSAETAIVPVILGDSYRAYKLSQLLFEAGIHAQPIVYPAVEENAARIRFFLSSNHTQAHLDETIEKLQQAYTKLESETSAMHDSFQRIQQQAMHVEPTWMNAAGVE